MFWHISCQSVLLINCVGANDKPHSVACGPSLQTGGSGKCASLSAAANNGQQQPQKPRPSNPDDPTCTRETWWWSRRVVSGARVLTPPSASGVGGVTRHPGTGAAQRPAVSDGQIIRWEIPPIPPAPPNASDGVGVGPRGHSLHRASRHPGLMLSRRFSGLRVGAGFCQHRSLH